MTLQVLFVVGEPGRSLVIATTRPETMLADVAVAVNPGDERYRDLVGKRVLLPIVNLEIPIIADEYADPAFGTGVVKITPAHDANDFDVGVRHGLPMPVVIDPFAAVTCTLPPWASELNPSPSVPVIGALASAVTLPPTETEPTVSPW